VAVWKEQTVPIQVPGEEMVLEGVWQAGEGLGGVVAPPHPEYGGSLANPVVNELAYGLHRAGRPSLRFNWRGVDGSQGTRTGDFDVAVADYGAAVAHLIDTVGAPLVGCGYSFGAATAVRAALATPQHFSVLVLVAPPVGMLQGLPLRDLPVPLHMIAGREDSFAPSDGLEALADAHGDAHLELLPRVDHFFASGGLAEIAQFVQSAVDG
jgi:alpha/beta superfamily hydrolase